MFFEPAITFENIHPGSRFGIEIEVCIKREKYENMGYGKSGPTTLNDTYEFKGDNPFNVGAPNLVDIILSTDTTCKCPEGFVNAEIISPLINYVELPIYLNLLRTKVFNNPEDFLQGKTCGIHVHWSNLEMMKYDDNPEYLFLFFKIIQNLRENVSLKITGSHFSGRQFYYKRDPNSDFNIYLYNISNKTRIIEQLEYKVKDYKNKSLKTITNEINNKKLNTYTLKDSFKTKSQFLTIAKDFFRERIDTCFIIYTCVLSNFTKFNSTLETNKFNIDSLSTYFENSKFIVPLEFDEDEILNRFMEYIDMELIFRDMRLYKKTDEDIIILNAIINFIYFLEESDILESNKVIEIIDIINASYNLIVIKDLESLYYLKQFFPEHINKEKLPILLTKKFTEETLLDFILEDYNKLGDLSFYDIKKGFHMEMRMFSLDSILYGKKLVLGNEIIRELTRFVLYTENFMMNVIDTLNKVYMEKQKNKIHPGKTHLLEGTVLWKKYNTPSQKKKIINKLFAMESVDRRTQRDMFGVITHIKEKGKTKKKPKKPSLKMESANKKKKKKPSLKINSFKRKTKKKKNPKKF